MEDKKMLVAVPTDFTKEAQCATTHASTIAKAGNGSIMLIHVLNREFKSKMKKEDRSEDDVRAQLVKDCENVKNTFGIPATYELPEGSIFSAIGETAEAKNATLMVMGTHGVVGLEQKILGAWALRVVSDSPAPVIIVQSKNPAEHGYKKVMVTSDYNKESKQLALHAIGMAKIFGGEVILFEGTESDEFLSKQTKLNVQFCQKLCNANGVANRVIQQSESNYHKELVKKAVSENVDLICIMSRKDMDLKTVFLGDDEQWLINNEAQIPVMCVNPSQTFGITNMVLNP